MGFLTFFAYKIMAILIGGKKPYYLVFWLIGKTSVEPMHLSCLIGN